MEQNKRRKAFYIVISILISAFIWFYVSYSESVTVSVDNVPVDFLNEETTLAERGLMVLDEDDITVDLMLRLPRSLVFRLDPDKVRVVADLSTVTSPGKQSITFMILYPNGISSTSVSVDSPSMRTVQVQIGELSRKNVEVRCKVVGNVAEGFTAGTLRMLPAQLEVRGQQVDIMQVNYAQVTLNITDATATIVELLDYELYDFNDQVIHNSNIHPVSDQIQITLPVMSAKEVPLVIRFEEAPGARLADLDYSLEPKSVMLSGDADAVNAIDEIVLGSISLDQLGMQESFSYPIELPAGVSNLSGVDTAALELRWRDRETVTLEATRFDYENLGADGEISVVTSTLPVTLCGNASDIAAVTADDIRVIADLSDIADASGSYTVPARVSVQGYDLGAVGNYEVTVHINSRG